MNMHYEYKADPRVCSESVSFDYEDGKICNIKIKGGCIGSNMSLCRLANGMYAEEIIARCAGISCNGSGTSCPDQLAAAVQNCLNTIQR